MLDIALKVAQANEVDKLPKMGAVLAYRGKVKAIGMNRRKSHPLQSKYADHDEKIWLHAEIDVIKNALKEYSAEEIKKFTLYIARVHKNNAPALAAPCDGCKAAIRDFGIKRVIWTE